MGQPLRIGPADAAASSPKADARQKKRLAATTALEGRSQAGSRTRQSRPTGRVVRLRVVVARLHGGHSLYFIEKEREGDSGPGRDGAEGGRPGPGGFLRRGRAYPGAPAHARAFLLLARRLARPRPGNPSNKPQHGFRENIGLRSRIQGGRSNNIRRDLSCVAFYGAAKKHEITLSGSPPRSARVRGRSSPGNLPACRR